MPKVAISHRDGFLLCRRCGVLHPLALDGVDGRSAEAHAFALDLQLFRSTHAPHSLELVMRLPAPAISDRPVWDPMATTWFQVAAGSDVLWVRSSRSSISAVRQREVATAPPPMTRGRVDVDARLLRSALDRHFYPHAIRPQKLDCFVRLVQELIGQLDPTGLATSFDDAELANAGIAPFPEALCSLLLQGCADIFDEWELGRVAQFIGAHRHEDGALALRVAIEPALLTA